MTILVAPTPKPLLLGMNNPLSDDPDFDLYPYPEGSAGYRLWKLMPEGTTRKQYLDAFERRNLVRSREWSPTKARAAAEALLPELDGRIVVVLGTEVRSALGLPKVRPLEMMQTTVPVTRRRVGRYVTFEWVALPHPSGRNHWYNSRANVDAARGVLQSLVLAAGVDAVLA